MSFRIISPSPLLSPYIRMYWTMESSLKPGEKHIQRIVPNGLTDITFYQENIPESTSDTYFLKDQTLISGQRNGHFDLIVSGKTKLFSVLFHPQGLAEFFKIPVSEIFNQTIPLRFLIGNQLDKTEDLLFEAKSVQKQVQIVENLFLNLLSKNEKKTLPQISESVYQINKPEKRTTIQLLAENACFSRKQFERKFTELIGISPKQFMRVVRFQRALFIQQKNTELKLTKLAFDSGYYDQPHMISEFKLLSGYTPKQYFDQCESFSDYFHSFTD